MTRPLSLFLLGLFLLGCPPLATVRNGELQKSGLRYSVQTLPEGWRKLALADNDLAYVHDGTEHSLALNSTCEGYNDASLDVLTRHLIMGFTEVKTLEQSHFELDGRDALRTHVSAKLDGVPLEMGFVVLKKDGCVYDFTYLAPDGHFADQVAAFDSVIGHFHAERTP